MACWTFWGVPDFKIKKINFSVSKLFCWTYYQYQFKKNKLIYIFTEAASSVEEGEKLWKPSIVIALVVSLAIFVVFLVLCGKFARHRKNFSHIQHNYPPSRYTVTNISSVAESDSTRGDGNETTDNENYFMELEFADHTAVDENHQTVHIGRSSSDLTINDQYEFGETGNGILHGKVFF